MSVVFDEESGRLRLDRASFDVLVDVASGSPPAAAELAELREAGVLTGSVIHPAVAPAAAAASNPVAKASLTLVSESGRQVSGDIWIDGDAAGYLMSTSHDSPGDLRELLTTAPPFFPVSVARVVGLGPRPQLHAVPWRMPPEFVDDLFAEEESTRRRIAATIAGTVDDAPTRQLLTSLATGPWTYWTLRVQWPPAAGHEGGRSLHVIDTEHGLLILSLSNERISADPSTATEVWQLLTMILPGDAELAF